MTLTMPQQAPVREDAPLVLEGVSWETYVRLRDETDAAGQHVRITYDRGRMVLMSPLPMHETYKCLIGRFVEVLTEELNLGIRNLGSTTWRRRKRRRGLEADQCFYIQSEPAIRGKTTIDLSKDPPPDLAIEIQITNHPLDRPSIYAALGVPELWRFDGQRLRAFRLNASGDYEPIERSSAFPALRVADLEQFLAMSPGENDNTIVKAFRKWVGEHLQSR